MYNRITISLEQKDEYNGQNAECTISRENSDKPLLLQEVLRSFEEALKGIGFKINDDQRLALVKISKEQEE